MGTHEGARAMSATLGSTVKDFREPRERAAAMPWLRIDPLLFLATVGLIGCSVYVVGGATQDDVPGNPNYYLYRQLVYGLVGIVFMLGLSRFDYSRLREWRVWGDRAGGGGVGSVLAGGAAGGG